MVVCQSSQGVEMRGGLLRLTRFLVVFELYSPSSILRVSEVFSAFKIIIRERTIYSGRAVIQNLVNAGLTVVCEATLSESSWMDVEFAPDMARDGRLREEFRGFLEEWQKLYRVLPEYKVAIADMQTFFSDLRLWLDQVELGIRSAPSADRIQLEHETARQLSPSIVPAINSLFERFEIISQSIEPDLVPAHCAFGQRQLHPLLLCSPFVYRTFTKPLGYAGDYEVVNMMFRDPSEGGSLFAKVVNTYALQLPPIVAHRNRISYLTERLAAEARRAAARSQALRVFNLGCGPAHEVQKFMAQDELSSLAHFALADFNEETLDHTASVLNELKRRCRRATQLQLIKKSVQQLLLQADRMTKPSDGEQYDLIYCAGLFDYLTDRVCHKLTDFFYSILAPGGLFVATNVDMHSARYEMECFLEWHLVYRNADRMLALAPANAGRADVTVKRDVTGVNVMMETRKPDSER